MQPRPLVSLCVPARNAARFIEETLRSIVAQTYANWELIIVETCSTDATRQIVKAFLAKQNDPRIQLHLNDAPLDMAGNWNRAVSLAKGQYIKLVCADDTLARHCLETELRVLEQDPGVVLVSSARKVINALGKPIFVRRGFSASGKHEGRATIWRCIRAGGTNIIGDPVVVTFRASALAQTGLFDPEIVYFTDLELWLRLLLRGDFYFIHEPLGCYRVHGAAVGTQVARQVVPDFLRVVDRIERLGGVRLSPWQRKVVACKTFCFNLARQTLYRLLA